MLKDHHMPKPMPKPEPEHDGQHLADQNQGPGSPDDRKDNRARHGVPQDDPDANPPYGDRG